MLQEYPQPGDAFVTELYGVDVYLTYCPSPFDLVKWRASFPGSSYGDSTISGAILSARGLWLQHRSAVGRWEGPAARRLELGELLALAKPWEQQTLGMLFGVWQGPLREYPTI